MPHSLGLQRKCVDPRGSARQPQDSPHGRHVFPGGFLHAPHPVVLVPSHHGPHERAAIAKSSLQNAPHRPQLGPFFPRANNPSAHHVNFLASRWGFCSPIIQHGGAGLATPCQLGGERTHVGWVFPIVKKTGFVDFQKLSPSAFFRAHNLPPQNTMSSIAIIPDPQRSSVKHMMITEDNANMFKADHFEFVKSRVQSAGSSDVDPKIELVVATHPDPEAKQPKGTTYLPKFEIQTPMRVRTCNKNPDGQVSKTTFALPLPDAMLAVFQEIDSAFIEQITDLEPGIVKVRKEAVPGRYSPLVDEPMTTSVAEWAMSGDPWNPYEKVLQSTFPGKKLDELDEDEKTKLKELLRTRIQTPVKDTDPKKRCWIKPLVRVGDDESVVYVSLMNFKDGKATRKKTTKGAKGAKAGDAPDELQQTVIRKVDRAPDGSWDIDSKREVTTEEALVDLQYDGLEGESSSLVEVTARVSIKWWWINAKHCNPTIHFDTLEYCLVPKQKSIAHMDIPTKGGSSNKKQKTEHEESE